MKFSYASHKAVTEYKEAKAVIYPKSMINSFIYVLIFMIISLSSKGLNIQNLAICFSQYMIEIKQRIRVICDYLDRVCQFSEIFKTY